MRSRSSYQREKRDCCVICLTETWMSAMVPDSAIELTGFSMHRSDRTKELTGKSRVGGVCFYINNSWCDERNLHSIKSFCSPGISYASVSTILATGGIYSDHNHGCFLSPSSQHRPGTQGTVWECCLNYLLAARKEYFISYLFIVCIFVEVDVFDCTYW